MNRRASSAIPRSPYEPRLAWSVRRPVDRWWDGSHEGRIGWPRRKRTWTGRWPGSRPNSTAAQALGVVAEHGARLLTAADLPLRACLAPAGSSFDDTPLGSNTMTPGDISMLILQMQADTILR